MNQLPADILGLLIIAPCAQITSVGLSEAWCSVDTTCRVCVPAFGNAKFKLYARTHAPRRPLSFLVADGFLLLVPVCQPIPPSFATANMRDGSAGKAGKTPSHREASPHLPLYLAVRGKQKHPM